MIEIADTTKKTFSIKVKIGEMGVEMRVIANTHKEALEKAIESVSKVLDEMVVQRAELENQVNTITSKVAKNLNKDSKNKTNSNKKTEGKK